MGWKDAPIAENDPWKDYKQAPEAGPWDDFPAAEGNKLAHDASKRQWYDVQNVEEGTLNALLATKPTTKAGAIVCIAHPSTDL
jgi:hypothetical protein